MKAIFFDLDGTLINSEPTAARVMLEAFQDWKIEIDPADSEAITGRTWALAFKLLYEKYSIPIPVEEVSHEVMRRYREALKQEVQVVPGAVEAVRDLAKEFPLALVSGSNREEILFALKKLDIIGHFQVILGAEDYPHSKPAPDGYAKAMEVLGVGRGQGLVFEDSTPGIASAKSAGLHVVGITSTNHFSQDQRGAGWLIPDLTRVNCQWVNALKIASDSG